MPIFYESRLARIELDEDEKPNIDAEIEVLTEEEASDEQERLKRKWATVEALVGSEKRMLVEADVVDCMVAMPGQLFYSTQIPACVGNGRAFRRGRDMAEEIRAA